VPDAILIFFCGAALLACLVAVVALARSRRRGGQMIAQPRAIPPMKSSLGAETPRISLAFGRELLPLLELGRTREAVALVRERTGWGAEEAAEAVARLENLRKRLGT
jgi:hypothetical protein